MWLWIPRKNMGGSGTTQGWPGSPVDWWIPGPEKDDRIQEQSLKGSDFTEQETEARDAMSPRVQGMVRG